MSQVDPQHIRTKADAAAVAAGFYFDIACAERVRQFFARFIRITSGGFDGTPRKLKPFTLLPWQWEDIICPLFGWRKPDGRRRFDRAYLSIAKKNGKSTLLAAIGLYLMLADDEPNSEVYVAAGDRDQAGIIYREAANMVKASAPLARVVNRRDSVKTLNKGSSFFKALSSEAGTKEGLIAHAILFDELHTQPNRELWDTLAYAGASRPQSILISITTAGGDLETICGEQYLYAKGILEGHNETDTGFYAYVVEADKDDDWTSEQTWKKANPSYGVTIDPEKFKLSFMEAKESPAKESAFRRYRLNQWVQSADAWLSLDQWDACAAPAVDPAALKGRECFAGLDLSATDDTTALVLLFPDADGGFTVLPRFYLPSDNIAQLERKHKVPYRAWAKRGLFTLTSGNVVDYHQVHDEIVGLAKDYQIKQLAIDRKFQGQSLESDLIEAGLPVIPMGQGWLSQDVPAKELERAIKAGRIRHGGHNVLRWHASNVVVDIDKNDNYTINKKKSRSKIDGIAALLGALFCMVKTPYEPPKLFVNKTPRLILLS